MPSITWGICMYVVYWLEIKCTTAIIHWKCAKSNSKLNDGSKNNWRKNPSYYGQSDQEKQVLVHWWFFLEVLPMAAGKLKRFGCSSDFVASDILPIFLLKSYNDKAWFLSFQLEANLFWVSTFLCCVLLLLLLLSLLLVV